ncbi:MAG: LysR substrate-binding domain-containing protein, partial [Cyanobacteria bacterium J06643_5]
AFLDNPLIVLAPVNHPLAGEKNIPISRLANEPFIMREPGSGTRRAVQQLFDEQNVDVKVKLELGSNEAIKQAIAGGLGISVLSSHTLMPYAEDLTILDVEYFPIKRNWYMVYPNGKQLSIVGHTYFEYLLEAAKQFASETVVYAKSE